MNIFIKISNSKFKYIVNLLIIKNNNENSKVNKLQFRTNNN